MSDLIINFIINFVSWASELFKKTKMLIYSWHCIVPPVKSSIGTVMNNAGSGGTISTAMGGGTMPTLPASGSFLI